MATFKPKDVRKKLKEIVKKNRANNRRNRLQDIKEDNKNNDDNNYDLWTNHKYESFGRQYQNFNPQDGMSKDILNKQYHGVWRCRKGGKRIYIGLDGKEYENKEARQQCILDKQTLEKLAETKRQLQSPSYLLYLQQQQLQQQQQNQYKDYQYNEKEKLSFWQIPSEIVENYGNKGIKKLYKWQIECLSLASFNFDNLIYCAPTSGGKTLICEILMIRQILLKQKKCLFILPFISLVCEKVNDLKSKLSSFGIIIEGYHSSISITNIQDSDIICCTIEKANSIINKLLEENNSISCLGCIVIDEFHYISDKNRGWILEILITKLLYLSNDNDNNNDNNNNLQIIGMSATLPNLNDIAKWMNAKLYITSLRPIQLTQFYKLKDNLYDINGKIIRNLKQIYKNDNDHVVQLCQEIVDKNGSVLVFCEKKIWCKQCCKMISDVLSSSSSVICNNNILINKRKLLIEELNELPQPICNILSLSILNGIAYHHAGLTLEEREIIENGFRKNIINILIATSTLAAGVNLPARRVIFRSIKIGKSFINPSKYKQMSGRAGRKGIDLYGQSIIICNNQSQVKYCKDKLLNAKLQPIKSQIININHIQRFILEAFSINIKTINQLNKYLKLNLKYNMFNTEKEEKEEKEKYDKQCENALNWLIKNEFIINDISIKELKLTSLGNSTIGSSLDPLQALIIYKELEKTRKEGIHFTNSLHLCYLLSPIRNNGGNIEPNWEKYYDLFMSFGEKKREIANSIGISENILSDYCHNIQNRPNNNNNNNNDNNNKIDYEYIKYKRFYCSIILNRIIEEKSIYEIEQEFGIDGGKMQSLQTSASSFANSLSIFCIKLNWNCMAQIIAHFSQRLIFGVCSELLPLMKISNIKSFRARLLFSFGIKTIEDIVNSSLETIILALSSNIKFDDNKLQKQLTFNHAKQIKFEANRIYQQLMQEEEQNNF